MKKISRNISRVCFLITGVCILCLCVLLLIKYLPSKNSDQINSEDQTSMQISQLEDDDITVDYGNTEQSCVESDACDETLKEDSEEDFHTNTITVIVKKATCTENGKCNIVCSVCGKVIDTKTLKSTGHVCGNFTTVKKATAISDGYKVMRCKKCGCVIQQKTITYKSCVQHDIDTRGAYGRLSIPSVGVDVALFKSWKQSVTDAADSANYMVISNQCTVIGDHCTQGFNAIKKCKYGTKLYIVTESGTEQYTFCGMGIGINNGKLIDKETKKQIDKDPVYAPLILYTCNNDGTITYVGFN